MNAIYFRATVLLLVLASYHSLYPQSATLTGPPIPIEPYLFGYNVNTFNGGPNWDNPTFGHTVSRLKPGNLRYPGGTIANYWDWRTGTIIATINSGRIRYRGDEFSYTPEEFLQGLPEGAEVIYCINMARPTPATGIDWDSSYEVLASQETLDAKIADILEGIQAWFDAGYDLKYVELGNEFYNGAAGGVKGQGAIYSGDPSLYVNHANQIAEAIHSRYPDIELAAIGESSREDAAVKPWTQTVYDAIADGAFNHVDAITFHWYTGPGVIQLENAEDAMNSLNTTFQKAQSIGNGDYANTPEALDIWVTEYNTFSQPRESSNPENPGNGGSIQGSWINGMFAVNLSVLYTMLGEQVSALNCHVISINNAQWKMILDEDNLSGNGVAMSAVGRAMNGMTTAQLLRFNNIPNPTFGNNGNPSLYGIKFSGDTREAIFIVNNTSEAKTGLSVGGLLTGSANRRLTQYHDPTPWTREISETEGIVCTYDDDVPEEITIPPFSITVVEQEVENLLVDASFEQSSDRWVTFDTFQENKKNAFTGTKSLLLETSTQGFTSAIQQVDVAPETDYTLTAWIRTNLANGSGRVQVRFFDEAQTEIRPRVSGPVTFGVASYRETRVDFTTPVGAVRAEVVLQLANGTGRVWFDDVVLRTAEAIVDPSMTTELTLQAKGKSGQESVRILENDQPIAVFALTELFQDYVFSAKDGANIKVEFFGDTGTKTDVEIKYIKKENVIFRGKDQAVNTGAWNSELGACGGKPSSKLNCNGYIDFGTLAVASAETSESAGWTDARDETILYPNPTADVLHLIDDGDVRSITLYDATGAPQREMRIEGNTSLDVSTLPNGRYLVKINRNDGSSETKRLIIEQ